MACPTCGGIGTTKEIELAKFDQIVDWLREFAKLNKDTGPQWKQVRCSEEGMWAAYATAVVESLPEDEREPFYKWVVGNRAIHPIYSQDPEKCMELWRKRKGILKQQDKYEA